MSGNDFNRRSFLKVMGWGGAGAALTGCDLPTTVTLEEGKETVVSYVMPEEYVIPGLGVWYATTCTQCSAGCGIHGRVREGRVLKLEGNPNSAVNSGKLCQMGQAGLQNHYNPDRIQKPMMRKGGSLAEVTWDEALAAIDDKTGVKSGATGNKVAWLTGTISGHQAVLLDAHLASFDSSSHYIHETINNAVADVVNKDIFGETQPVYHVNKAKAILSFGADLVGVSQSPVHFSRQYAEFRSAPRGMLIQVEPSMSLTGANADLWLPVRPGTEGVLAMGIANVLVNKHGADTGALPSALSNAIADYTPEKAAQITGLDAKRIEEIATKLQEKSPSLVLTGASAQGHAHGYQSVAAAAMLNVLLGNVGKTVTAAGEFPFPQLRPKVGNTRDLFAFAEGADKGAFDAVFIHGTNPAYTAPAFLKFGEKLDKVPFKVVLTQFMDETTKKHADVVLPLASSLEDWGTHVPAYQPGATVVAMQQPVMEKLYADTRGTGDILLSLLKGRRPDDYTRFNDYYAYLQNAFAAMPAEFKKGADDAGVWAAALQTGFVAVDSAAGELSAKPVAVSLPGYEKSGDYPMHLVPSARLGMWDGRHANLPWLQEAPDQISKVVWGSWAEIHPRTASRLGVENGDFVSVSSPDGSLEVPVYIHRGVHPDAVAVPMGRGHESYGRYADGVGVNPLKILSNATDAKTGELALYGTRVSVTKIGKKSKEEQMVRFGGSETQVGRKLVASITAETFNRTEGA